MTTEIPKHTGSFSGPTIPYYALAYSLSFSLARARVSPVESLVLLRKSSLKILIPPFSLSINRFPLYRIPHLSYFSSVSKFPPPFSRFLFQHLPRKSSRFFFSFLLLFDFFPRGWLEKDKVNAELFLFPSLAGVQIFPCFHENYSDLYRGI